MNLYAIRRVGLAIPTLFILSVMVFLIVRVLPGDVVTILSEGMAATPEQLQSERRRLGLDRPLYDQYIAWTSALARGDMGNSLWSGRPVGEELLSKLPVTAELGILALLFSVSIGVPAGIVSAVKRDTAPDYLGRSIAVIGLAVPNFWLATVILIGLSLIVGWVPQLTYVPIWIDPWQNVVQFIMPAMVLGTHLSALVMRITRTTMLDVLNQDYVRTAWAKGLKASTVVARHALRNALIPVITVIGLETAQVAGGSIVMEAIFGLPGVGKYVFDVILVRDYPAVQGVMLYLGAFVIIVNLMVDVSLAYFDPRIRYR